MNQRRFQIALLIGLFVPTVALRPDEPPCPEPATLEDIYGDTGNTFQAAIGFVNFEGTTTGQAQQSYGLAIDDMVVKWREFVLEPDATDCAVSGSCAVVELATSNVFEGQTVLTITVLEVTPDASNDCDLDGASDGTDDCNANGIPDVVVEATSQADVAGEIVWLDETVAGVEYKGTLQVSALADGPGVLFIASQGGDLPVVTVTYLDHDDGTGSACANDPDPAKHGFVRSSSTVFLGPTCDIRIFGQEIEDNGDNDDFADTDETIAMRLELLNDCGIDLHDCTARIFALGPEVECIIESVIDLGDLEASGASVLTDEAFVWKLASVERNDVDEPLFADFGVTVSCDEFDTLSSPQSVSVELDLDFDDLGQTPVAWIEGFESGTLGNFETENLDYYYENHAEWLDWYFDGWRCQYSDPDWPNSNSYGNDIGWDCFPGMNLDHANAVYWQVDGIDTGSPDGGRARSGDYSMYYGVYLTDPAGHFTTPMAVVESVRTIDPINLGVHDPELSFWHQISLMDGRYVNIDPSRNADRGVVQVKTVDAAGDDASTWMRLEPFQNAYDTQNYDFYFNCMFDPIDDGNTEDDFFDPTDPNRRLGPSSTCHPEFTYSCLGDTHGPFAPGNICNATTPPTVDDAGSLGAGTWVESRIDLGAFRARRIKLRYLVSAIKASAETHDGQFDGVNPGWWDDGWWIDDIEIDETLTDPAVIRLDTKVLHRCAGDESVGCLDEQDCGDAGVAGPCTGAAPSCGPVCTGVTAVVETEPDRTGGPLDERLAAPGQAILLNAAPSHGRCLDGSLQFRFSVDGGPTLRDWSANPVLLDAPRSDVDYRVEVRCSTDLDCLDAAVIDVDVACPSSGGLAEPFAETIRAQPGKTEFAWITPVAFDLFTGELDSVAAYAGVLSSSEGNSFFTTETPPSGRGFYFVVRPAGEFCNDAGLWTSGGPAESPLREISLP